MSKKTDNRRRTEYMDYAPRRNQPRRSNSRDLDELEYYKKTPAAPQKKKKKKKKKKRRVGKIILMVLLALIIVVLGVGGVMYFHYRGIYDDPGSIITRTPVPQKEIEYITYKGEEYYENTDVARFVLLGIDAGEDRKELGARTDVMIVVAVDLKQNKITGIEIPRDTRAEIDLLDSQGNVIRTEVSKINGAFQYGGRQEGHGPENSMKAINKFMSLNGKYDLKLEDYAGINMDGIGPLTDALGGVTVTLRNDMDGIGRAGETVTLHGEQGNKYCRMRKGSGLDGSDLGRGKRQMDYMFGCVDRVRSMGASQIPGVLSAVSKYTFMNLSVDEVVAYASACLKIPSKNIQLIQVPGASMGKSPWHYIADEDKLEELIINTFYLKKPDGSTIRLPFIGEKKLDVYLPDYIGGGTEGAGESGEGMEPEATPEE